MKHESAALTSLFAGEAGSDHRRGAMNYEIKVSLRADTSLPIELQSKLHVPARVRGGDGAESGAAHGVEGWLEIDLVESIESLSAELEIPLFRKVEPPGDAEVPLLEARS